ncbi:hypothetical protein RDWZM_000321 [Blomia tropicalis]|uniref:Uncharacterized protein n=1 Tax=Blomia tropicalis TaxID=40697 RepID=A0A9Q0M9D5_BLOTA|nr:hypothetical protein RDWZM_000321 [Blomia tropicalis]
MVDHAFEDVTEPNCSTLIECGQKIQFTSDNSKNELTDMLSLSEREELKSLANNYVKKTKYNLTKKQNRQSLPQLINVPLFWVQQTPRILYDGIIMDNIDDDQQMTYFERVEMYWKMVEANYMESFRIAFDSGSRLSYELLLSLNNLAPLLSPKLTHKMAALYVEIVQQMAQSSIQMDHSVDQAEMVNIVAHTMCRYDSDLSYENVTFILEYICDRMSNKNVYSIYSFTMPLLDYLHNLVDPIVSFTKSDPEFDVLFKVLKLVKWIINMLKSDSEIPKIRKLKIGSQLKSFVPERSTQEIDENVIEENESFHSFSDDIDYDSLSETSNSFIYESSSSIDTSNEEDDQGFRRKVERRHLPIHFPGVQSNPSWRLVGQICRRLRRKCNRRLDVCLEVDASRNLDV